MVTVSVLGTARDSEMRKFATFELFGSSTMTASLPLDGVSPLTTAVMGRSLPSIQPLPCPLFPIVYKVLGSVRILTKNWRSTGLVLC